MSYKPTDPRCSEALDRVAEAAHKVKVADREFNEVMRAAHDLGISLRDIADVADLSHQTAKNRIARVMAPE